MNKPIKMKDNPELFRIVSTRADQIMPQKIIWWWENKVPRGILVTIAGLGGLGKSTVCMDLVARHTTGQPFPGCTKSRIPERAGILNMEDDPATIIIPRLDAAGADRSMVHIMESALIGEEESWIDVNQHCELIENFIEDNKLSFLVIDPVTGHIGSTKQNDGGEVRRALQPLQAVAQRTDCTIMCVTHSPKNSTTAQSAVIGSQSFVNTSRCVFTFVEHPDEKGRFLMLNPKNNYSHNKNGFAYALQDTGDCAKVVWEDEPITDDPNSFYRIEGLLADKQTILDKTRNQLSEFLTEPKAKSEIDAWAKAHNITPATLRRAKEANGHEVEKRADGWYWLPMTGAQIWAG